MTTNITKISTIVLVMLSTILLSGCATQTGGGEFDAVRLGKGGLSLFRIRSNGVQAVVGNPEMVDSANARFNETVKVKEGSSIVKKGMEEDVIKNGDELNSTLAAMGF